MSRADGSISLRNILVPVAAKPSAQGAVEVVMRMIGNLQLPPGKITLLYVGHAEKAPRLGIPATSDWTWHTITREGEPHEVILQVAADTQADLIVMTTEGPHGFLDALRGSTSERVLRGPAALCWPCVSEPERRRNTNKYVRAVKPFTPR